MDESAWQVAERAYRTGLWAMRGGVVAALLVVLALPAGEGQLLLFAVACLAVAWGAWQRRRHCPRRRPGGTLPRG